MKTYHILPVFTALISGVSLGASATINITAGHLRDADGVILADADTETKNVWAIIVAGTPGNPPTAGSLPGNLTLGQSLTDVPVSQRPTLIGDAFDDVSLTIGDKGSYYIAYLQDFDSGSSPLETEGFAYGGFSLDVNASGDPGFTAGTIWGLYWFPGKSIGDTLTGSYEVGGFTSAASPASGGEIGTVVPASGATVTANFYETNFNQVVLEGDDTGISVSRFTAVAIPEPGTLTLSGLAALALLRRRRA